MKLWPGDLRDFGDRGGSWQAFGCLVQRPLQEYPSRREPGKHPQNQQISLTVATNGSRLRRFRSYPRGIGSSPVTGVPANETGPSTESLTVAASLTSWGFEMVKTMAPL
jgi:hypothetical protein